jgi:hypothetical protein
MQAKFDVTNTTTKEAVELGKILASFGAQVWFETAGEKIYLKA